MTRTKCKTTFKLDEILAIVQTECPEAFAAFPAIETFTLYDCNNDEEKKTAGLKVGYRNLLRPARTEEIHVRLDFSREYPWLDYYSDETFLNTKSFRRVHLNKPFSHLGSDPWSNEMRALVEFLFILNGNSADFRDFGMGQGVKSLIRALRVIQKKAPPRPNQVPESLDSHKLQADSFVAMIEEANVPGPETEKGIMPTTGQEENFGIEKTAVMSKIMDVSGAKKENGFETEKRPTEKASTKEENGRMEKKHGTKRSHTEFLDDSEARKGQTEDH